MKSRSDETGKDSKNCSYRGTKELLAAFTMASILSDVISPSHKLTFLLSSSELGYLTLSDFNPSTNQRDAQHNESTQWISRQTFRMRHEKNS